ncbi:MAG: hypothetical protein DMG33_18390 [Acidobacteria bacterium]|nr:MAG: hypothetical protein DMG33_18390 [Acidobacteriota bacterium]
MNPSRSARRSRSAFFSLVFTSSEIDCPQVEHLPFKPCAATRDVSTAFRSAIRSVNSCRSFSAWLR